MSAPLPIEPKLGTVKRKITISAKPRTTRSPKWSALRKNWLKTHKICEACGTNKTLQVHHLVPVSIDRSRELDQSNLVTLCEFGSHDCHFHFGHLLNWATYNADCLTDSHHYFDALKARQSLKTQSITN